MQKSRKSHKLDRSLMDTRFDKVVLCWNSYVVPISIAVYKEVKKNFWKATVFDRLSFTGSSLLIWSDHAVAETNAINQRRDFSWHSIGNSYCI